MKKIIYIIMFVMALSIVYAENYALGANIERVDICINNGALCSNGNCNKTIYYPNRTVAVDNFNMTARNNSKFNYTFSNTNILGEYPEITTCCDSDGKCKTLESSFFITLNGQDGVNRLNILLAAGVMALTLFLFAFLTKGETPALKVFKITSGMFGLGIVLILIPATVISDKIALKLFRWGTILSYIYGVFLLVWISISLYQYAIEAWFSMKK